MLDRRKTLLLACASLVLARPGLAAWPERPIRFIVPYGAGGSSDVVARLVAPRMAERLGQPIVVENRTGGGIVVGGEAVASAAPDGHTVLVGVSTLSLLPNLRQPPRFDVRRNFAAVTPLVELAYAVLAHPRTPFSSLGAMIEYAKRHPGRLNYASNGQGTASHLVGEQLRQRAGIDIVHVPYRGSGPQTTALIAGEVQLSIDGFGSTTPHIRDGSIKLLAVTSEQPSPIMPEAPLAKDTLPGFTPAGWIGLLVPAGTPPAVIEALHAAARDALEHPPVQGRLTELGMTPLTTPPAAFARRIVEEIETWRQVMAQGGLVID